MFRFRLKSKGHLTAVQDEIMQLSENYVILLLYFYFHVHTDFLYVKYLFLLHDILL